MSELALELIEEEKQERTGTLNISQCGLTEIPTDVSKLLWLETLIIGDSYHIGKRGKRVRGSNQSKPNIISDLKLLANLNSLQQLDCSNTQVSDLTPLVNLSNLQLLDCSNTQVTDLTPLVKLNELQKLVFHYTPIKSLSPLAKLSKLQLVDCSGSQVTDLTPLTKLVSLQKVYCSNTQVADLSPLSKLTDLRELWCYKTKVNDVSPLANLNNLEEIELSETEVSDISPLKLLLRTNLEIKWEEFIFEGGLNIKNCQLIAPPIEFAMEGHDAVMEYFDQLGDDGKNLNELKVIFLGEGASGKTSLIRRLRREDFNPEENQTHGIRIRKTPFDIDGETVDAHLWDFGGQEVMHATHQFFLSQRCIYVLVLNCRTDDKAEYWLKHTSSFGGKSPVLVVLNKIDETPSFDVNRKVLSEKYPQIKGYYRLSCQTDEGIEAFEQALQEQVRQSDTRRTPFPTAWLAVKNHFADMDKDYIESAEYRDVCIQNGVDKSFSQNVLLQFLHDLGVIINFRNLKNFDTQILNPLWLTNGVYRVINSGKITENKGLLHEDDFNTVINDPRYANGNTTDKVFYYPCNKLHYIVRVMQEFELCFPLDNSQYVIPQLLPVEEPEFNFNGAVLHFVVRFTEFLPDSIFPRLMVKLHNYIKDDLRWRSGMVLSKPSVFKAEARIRADKEDQKITIDACGEEPRRLLSFVRATLKEITEGFTDLPFEEQVPIPDSDVLWSYTELADMEEMGVTEFPIGKLKKKFSVKDLLDGVEEPSMRDEVAQLPVKAFISYSSKDLQYMQDELLPALAPLRRLNKLQVWYDRTIDAGADWEKEIMDNLAEADIVLCLVSSDFINSEFCFRREFEVALEDHHKDKKTIVPIRLRECDWDDLALSDIQGRPSQWIDSFSNRDKAWTEVAKGLKPVIEQAQQRRKKWLDEKKRENVF
ncbi:MAG: GTP-binding protein [Thiothrix lacustris]|uniref:non-specific serine/threonine protein kinase n=1 Tax=Thiothrix lacustris TaxID=525917 RepID=A0A1Y1QBG3_9GAMM|nr:MAG: GTP-binding protein [Thiothrix lacustris]